MAEKLHPEEIREMKVKDIQRTINDLTEKKKKVMYGDRGAGATNNPAEDIGTIKRNIARCKTILNERLQETQ